MKKRTKDAGCSAYPIGTEKGNTAECWYNEGEHANDVISENESKEDASTELVRGDPLVGHIRQNNGRHPESQDGTVKVKKLQGLVLDNAELHLGIVTEMVKLVGKKRAVKVKDEEKEQWALLTEEVNMVST